MTKYLQKTTLLTTILSFPDDLVLGDLGPGDRGPDDWGPGLELWGPNRCFAETGWRSGPRAPDRQAASGPSKFSNDSIDLLLEQIQSCKG